MFRRLLLFLLFSSSLAALAQIGTLSGTVVDEEGKPMERANVSYDDGRKGTTTDAKGRFQLELQANKTIRISFSYLNHETIYKNIRLKPEQTQSLRIVLRAKSKKIEATVLTKRGRSEAAMTWIPVNSITEIPSTTGGIEGLLKTLPGVSSSNELSSQYSVRGGNFDENLVYVNDFEIIRPFLVRSGQQEGLSFINPDLVKNVLFSSGGFQAKYGDKMSSVLDIEYKKPKEFKGSASMSLLGGGFHFEGDSKNHRFRYLFGLRQKSNQYILDALDTKGEYRPSFTDIQTFISYDLSTEWELELIGNYSRNLFQFVPEDRVTTTGVFNRVIRLTVFFDGQEVDQFESLMGGAAVTYRPNADLRLKFLTSSYYTREQEAFDIIGQYWLDEVETSFGKDEFGESAFNLGVGTFQDWARNDLTAYINNIGHKGFWAKDKHSLQWGFRVQAESIDDQLSEWGRLDSAGYSLPFDPSEVLLDDVVKSTIDLNSIRASTFFQDTWELGDSGATTFTYGSRLSYWDLNEEWLVSPRIQLSYKPLGWDRDIAFRLATGVYNQQPFYRELRDLEGNINLNIKSQKSYHVVLGSDLEFTALGGRPFKFVAELYYKYLTDVIPYEFDNVRIRYFGDNTAKGYAAGIDLRVYGEFVKNADSWVSLSIMQTQEDIDGDFYYDKDSVKKDVGFIPRPTDQRVNVGMYFQDYFPNNENFKVHLNFIFGSSLPFGPPDHERAKDTLRAPPYRRVDVGFSALLVDGKKEAPPKAAFRHFTSIWASLELFNLIGAPNVSSYVWVKDFTNTVYALPNFLTGRRLNLKLIARF
jgi:hypothetical protein